MEKEPRHTLNFINEFNSYIQNLDSDLRQQIGDCLIDMEVYKGITRVFLQIISIFEEKFPKMIPNHLSRDSVDYKGVYDFQSSIAGSVEDKSVFSVESQDLRLSDRKFSMASRDCELVSVTNGNKVDRKDSSGYAPLTFDENYSLVIFEEAPKIISNFLELIIMMCRSRPDFLTSIFLSSHDSGMDKKGKTFAAIFPELMALPIPGVGGQLCEFLISFISPTFETCQEMQGILRTIIAPAAIVELEREYFIYWNRSKMRSYIANIFELLAICLESNFSDVKFTVIKNDVLGK
jgi:hypothetical protein